MKVVTTPEYDAFGPWILPVSSHDQVPPVFRTHPIDFTRAHDVLKVPREIARRDASPRSHLYDSLLVLDHDGIEVLTREGHRFSVRRISRRDVAAVDSGTALLAGWFSVRGTDGSSIDVSFNGSSLPVITDLADRLLGWVADDLDGLPVQEHLDQDALGYHDVGLVNGYDSLPPEPRRRVTAAFAERMPVAHRPRLHRLMRGDAHLSGAVMGTDHQHAVVLARSEWVRHTRKPDLSLRRLVIPTDRITDLSAEPHPYLDGVTDLTVHCDRARIPLSVPTDHADAVASTFAPLHAAVG